MNLKVLLPSEILLDRQVLKLTAEAPNGFFCLLPRHIDFVATIVPGILSFLDSESVEHFVAVDEGTLVKCGPQVLVSTRHAVMSEDLGQLQQVVERQFESIDERERLARSAAARLESGMVRRFMDLEKRP